MVHRREHHPHRQDAQLTRAVKQIGAGWQGRAAEAVQGGMTVMSNWALDAAGDASLTKNGISAQAEQAGGPVAQRHAAPARTAEWNRVVQEEVPGIRLVSAMGDLGALEEQMADDHAVAVEMMNRYSGRFVGQPAPDELLDAAADGRRRGRWRGRPRAPLRSPLRVPSERARAPVVGQVRRPMVRRVAAASTRRRPPCRRSGYRTSTVPHHRPAAVAVQARPRRSGRRTARGRAVSDRRRYPDGHPGPSIRTRIHRSAGEERFPEPPPTVAVPPRGLEQARSPSESAPEPAGRRVRSNGGRDPVLAPRGRRPPRGTRPTRPTRGCRRLAHRPAHCTRHSTRHRRAAGRGATHPRSRHRRTAAPRRRSRRGSTDEEEADTDTLPAFIKGEEIKIRAITMTERGKRNRQQDSMKEHCSQRWKTHHSLWRENQKI